MNFLGILYSLQICKLLHQGHSRPAYHWKKSTFTDLFAPLVNIAFRGAETCGQLICMTVFKTLGNLHFTHACLWHALSFQYRLNSLEHTVSQYAPNWTNEDPIVQIIMLLGNILPIGFSICYNYTQISGFRGRIWQKRPVSAFNHRSRGYKVRATTTRITLRILLPHPHVLLQMMRLSNAKRRLVAREERMRGTLWK